MVPARSVDRRSRSANALSLRARRARARERGSRRDHDRAMADPRVAAEHRLAIDRSRARGDGGCVFCEAGGRSRLACADTDATRRRCRRRRRSPGRPASDRELFRTVRSGKPGLLVPLRPPRCASRGRRLHRGMNDGKSLGTGHEHEGHGRDDGSARERPAQAGRAWRRDLCAAAATSEGSRAGATAPSAQVQGRRHPLAEVLAEDATARATIQVLNGVRSIVDVNVYVWMPATERWRLLTFDEQRLLWSHRDPAPATAVSGDRRPESDGA